MQAIVSESLSNDVEMTRQAKRFKKGCLENNEYVPITHKIPFTRLKLQFPNLNEESLQTLLKDCDNDMMKAIRNLNKGKKSSYNCNPFSNQENKSSNIDFSPSSIKRKRRFNEISNSSNESSKDLSHMSDEEEKSPTIDNPEEVNRAIEGISYALFDKLKSASTEETALNLIKEGLGSFKEVVASSRKSPRSSKGKDFEKERKAISEAIKKLITDNVTLKKGINILVKKNEENCQKVSQFDNLVKEYQKLQAENQDLRRGVDILKYKNSSEKCDEGMFNNFNHFGGAGGSGVF